MVRLQQAELTKGDDHILACDYDYKNRLASLVRRRTGDVVARVANVVRHLPAEWQSKATRIRWFSEEEALIWPTCLPTDNPSYVGVIGEAEPNILPLG